MADSLTISQAFAKYRTDYILMNNQSVKTEESYSIACKLLVRKYGDDLLISDLTFEMVRDWREWLGGWQSQDTIRNNVICVRMVLKFLRKKNYPVLNYEEIPVQKHSKRKITFLTADEVEEFIGEVACKQRGYSEINRLRNVAIVHTLFAAGLRNTELCMLDRRSIKDRTFTVIGKSRDERISFINKRAEAAIEAYLARRTDSNIALFISHHTGKRITSSQLRDVFKVVCARSEKFNNVHPHTIRHSYATDLLEHKVDLSYISDLMGHQDLNTTKMYTHYSNPKLKEIYDQARAY